MANNKFNITIGAVDKATGVIRKVKKQFSQITRPVVNLQRSVGRLGKEIGFDKMRASLGRATRAAQDFGGRLFSLGAPLMGLIGGGTIAGLGAMVSSFASASVQAKNMAQSIGISTGALSSYRGAAVIAGVGAGELDNSLKSLGQTMQDAAFGRNQQAYMFMRRLGVGFHKTKEGAVDVTKTLTDLSRVITNPKIKNNPAVQQRIASTFGVESLLPLLRKGPKAIAEYQKKIDEVSFKPSKQGDENASRFHESMQIFKASIDGVKSSIADKLLPVLEPVIAKFTRWIVANREMIASKIGDFFSKLATFIENIDFEKLINQCKSLFSTVNNVVEALGGWKTIVIAIAAIKLAGFIGSILSTAGALTNVLAPALRLVLGIIVANPIVAAVLAIAGAAYLIYRNWDAVKQFFIDIWEEIKGAFDGGIEGISDLIINWSPLGLFYKVFQKVMDYFGIKLPKKFSDFGKNIIGNLIRGIKGEAPVLMSEVDNVGDNVNNRLENKKSQFNANGWGSTGGVMAGVMGQMAGGFNVGGHTKANLPLFEGLEKQYQLPKGLLDGLWRTESGRGKNMLSKAGAMGHFQFMPDTAKRFGLKNPYDLNQSAQAAAKYMQYLMKFFKGDVRSAITAYNWGEGNMRSYLKTGRGVKGQMMPQESRGYFGKVAKDGLGAPLTTNFNKGTANSYVQQQPLEITINSNTPDTKVTATRGNKVVPVKVNYAMSTNFAM